MSNGAESQAARLDRVIEIVQRLRKAHPDAQCSLDHDGPFQLLIATILAAQCTDDMVNRVTPALFAKWPAPGDLASARLPSIEKLIKPTGFFRNKSRSLKNCAAALIADHGGSVPAAMDALTALPGVGRKTANVVLAVCFDTPAIIVDTHFKRLTTRLGLHTQTDPEKIEAEMTSFVPQADWTDLSHGLLFHGRRVCISRAPRCPDCVLADLCPYPSKTAH